MKAITLIMWIIGWPLLAIAIDGLWRWLIAPVTLIPADVMIPIWVIGVFFIIFMLDEM